MCYTVLYQVLRSISPKSRHLGVFVPRVAFFRSETPLSVVTFPRAAPPLSVSLMTADPLLMVGSLRRCARLRARVCVQTPLNGAQSMIESAVPQGLLPDPNVHAAWALFFSRFISAYKELVRIHTSCTPYRPWYVCRSYASYILCTDDVQYRSYILIIYINHIYVQIIRI